MFNLFKKKPPECPVDEDTRKWIEQDFDWLFREFGVSAVRNKRILVPTDEHFPVFYDGSIKCAQETLKIVAQQMEVPYDDILLLFYSQGRPGQRTGVLGNGIEVDPEAHIRSASGKYHGRHDDGKYHISLEEQNLRDPLKMVSTLAHELAHVKLLGEGRMDDNNEHLTDLTTTVFGLGVFNANAAFRFARGQRQWEYRQLGYLTQIQWGYALAVYAHLGGSTDDAWTNYLNDTVLGNYKRGAAFIKDNAESLHIMDFVQE